MALALTIGSLLPFAFAAPSASAAPYCPNPYYCSTGYAGYLRWITCGSWVYNRYIGLYCDRCNSCLA